MSTCNECGEAIGGGRARGNHNSLQRQSNQGGDIVEGIVSQQDETTPRQEKLVLRDFRFAQWLCSK